MWKIKVMEEKIYLLDADHEPTDSQLEALMKAALEDAKQRAAKAEANYAAQRALKYKAFLEQFNNQKHG